MKARILSTDIYDGAELEVDQTCTEIELPSPDPVDKVAYRYIILGVATDGKTIYIEESLLGQLSRI